MGRRALVATGLVLLLAASFMLFVAVRTKPPVISTASSSRAPARLVFGSPGVEESVEAPAPQWGRPQIIGDPERWPPNRADWSDEPDNWELLPVSTVSAIPPDVRNVLEPLDCAIPRYGHGTIAQNIVWGEFERHGQRDLAVLCVHQDKTSATYVFWAADPRRREVMPQSGSAINTATPVDMRVRLDPESPREPDMPMTLDYDGLKIGCCECCSTIYYRHGGKWFTLPGAD